MTELARTKGFTLLEILVAVAVFAIFSAMAYGGLMRLLDNRQRIDAERAFWRETALAFVRMQQDLSLARNRRIRDNDGISIRLAFIGQPTDTRAVSEPSVEFTRGGILVPNGTTANLQRTGYRLVDGTLMRITWPVLDRAPLTKPDMTPLLHDVEEFQARFYVHSNQPSTPGAVQSGATRPGEGWSSEWPPLLAQASAAYPALPRAVEVTVAIKGRGKFTRVFMVGIDK